MKIVKLNTGGRIHYSKLNRRGLWTEEMDIIVFREMSKPISSLNTKARNVIEIFNNNHWGMKYPSTIINRYSLIKRAIKDTLIEFELS